MTAWLSNAALQSMGSEASGAYPNETGGLLVGYIAPPTDIVVQSVIGPGPNTCHERARFRPDHQ